MAFSRVILISLNSCVVTLCLYLCRKKAEKGIQDAQAKLNDSRTKIAAMQKALSQQQPKVPA